MQEFTRLYDMRQNEVDKPKSELARLKVGDFKRGDFVFVEATVRRFARADDDNGGASFSKKKGWTTWRVEFRLEHMSLISHEAD